VSTPFRVTKSSNPRAAAQRVVEGLVKGETTVSCTAYGRRRLRGHDVEAVLHAIHAFVLAELPAVKLGYAHFPGGERLWVWSLGEPTPVAFWPRQQPETLDVEIELQGAMPTPAERFPQREFG
jgi:hypothetical protein